MPSFFPWQGSTNIPGMSKDPFIPDSVTQIPLVGLKCYKGQQETFLDCRLAVFLGSRLPFLGFIAQVRDKQGERATL